MSPEHVLVTGGAGFIGGHLVAALLKEGARVSVLDNLSTGRRARVPQGATFIEGDVRDAADVAKALNGVDGVVHLAARVTVRGSVDSMGEDHDVNVGGTLSVLKALEGRNVARFVHASSMAVYADARDGAPVTEEHPTVPLSPYGASKLAAENYARLRCSALGVRCVNLRYFNTWGPGQRTTPYVGVITIFMDRLRAGRPCLLFGDGLQTRDFIHVDDVVDATLCALRSDVSGHPSINVGTGLGTTVLELASMVADAMGCRIEHVFEAARPEELAHSVADIHRAKALLGFAPKRPLTVQALAALSDSRDSALP